MTDEIRMASRLLNALDGRTDRTFAYPCGDASAGDSSYVNAIRNDFLAARGVKRRLEKIYEIDLFDVDAYTADGQSGGEMIGWVKEALANSALLVICFHGVGGGHSMNVSLDAHAELLRFLKQNEETIWVAPMREIAKCVAEHRLKRAE
jgi:hypothetical protein